MEPVMEAVMVPGQISGSEIIDDVCGRIADKLERSCDLRPVDVYRGYAAKVTIELQLLDVYPVDVAAQVDVDTFDPLGPTQKLVIDTEAEGVENQPLGEGLDRPVDPAGVTETPAPVRRRYISRIRGTGQ